MITDLIFRIMLVILNSTALVIVCVVIFDLSAEILMEMIRKWPK